MNVQYNQQAVNDEFWSECNVFVVQEDRANRQNTFTAVCGPDTMESIAQQKKSVSILKGLKCTRQVMAGESVTA